ncbi:MAG: radical SAM protein [Ignisphaera sp.]|uniref:Radical SAM protein n=1 Tax=Ignisphaera aggregans TaxID=334771 RepID=A0A7C4JL95_9CREN
MTFGVRSRFTVNKGNFTRCLTCERRCLIPPNGIGICGNYKNIDGVLYNVGYGKISVIESRPIEIKPLFHYWPNSTATTFSFWGCNFYCPWCQNHHLSFTHPKEYNRIVPPDELVKLAILFGDEGFSASFNEPTVSVEYLLDLAELSIKNGLYLTVVTNGYQTVDVLNRLLEFNVDGWSIDIKGCPMMRKALPSIDHSLIYRNAKHILSRGGHIEMVYLVVTNTNDFDECIEWIIDKHLNELGSEVPLHVNRYYPAHKWSEPPTPADKLLKIAHIAKKEGIEYVYIGNYGDPELESTKCPKCGKILIFRYGYRVREFNLDRDGEIYKCPRCRHRVPIRGKYVAKRGLLWI